MSVDISSDYLGLRLRSPLVASAGPLTRDIEKLRLLSEAGVGAVVLPSLFEEQFEDKAIQWERQTQYESDSFAENPSRQPNIDSYNSGPEEYLGLIETAKKVVDVPVIANLNGQRLSGWARYAQSLERAGADAIELNVYRVVTDPGEAPGLVEDEYVDLVLAVSDAVSIPVSVKLGSQFTALPHFAQRLQEAGASGLVLFNRFLYPSIDLEEMRVTPHLTLSQPSEALQVIRWIAILRDCVDLSLAATSGVHTSSDVLKMLLVGADVVMMTSALLKFGPKYMQTVTDELTAWLKSKGYESVSQLRGSMSLKNAPDPAGFERANYMQALMSYSRDPN